MSHVKRLKSNHFLKPIRFLKSDTNKDTYSEKFYLIEIQIKMKPLVQFMQEKKTDHIEKNVGIF